MQHVDNPGELNRVDRAVRVAVEIIDDLEDTCAAKAFQRLGERRLQPNLGMPETSGPVYAWPRRVTASRDQASA